MDLAEKAKISKQRLYKYENNIVTNIPSDVLEVIAYHLEVSPAYLMGWDEKPAEELQGMGALAAQVIMDQDAMEMAQAYMQLNEADRYAVRLVIASMAQKKTDAGASVVKAEKCAEKADCDM